MFACAICSVAYACVHKITFAFACNVNSLFVTLLSYGLLDHFVKFFLVMTSSYPSYLSPLPLHYAPLCSTGKGFRVAITPKVGKLSTSLSFFAYQWLVPTNRRPLSTLANNANMQMIAIWYANPCSTLAPVLGHLREICLILYNHKPICRHHKTSEHHV